MTTIDASGNIHRAEGSPQGGQFAGKQNSRPRAQLQSPTGPTVYRLLVSGEPAATSGLIHPEWLDALQALRAVNPEAEISLSATRGNTDVQFSAPAPGEALVVEVDGTFLALHELHERGIHLTDPRVEVHREPIIPFDDPEERVDLENVRLALTDSPGDGPYMVDAIRDHGDPLTVNLEIAAAENFRWNGQFSEELLDEHQDIVKDVYREWFNAEIDVPDTWENASVTLRVDVETRDATNRLLVERAHRAWAKYRNETDPGTFGSPFVGAEIQRRIDEKGSAE